MQVKTSHMYGSLSAPSACYREGLGPHLKNIYLSSELKDFSNIII